MADLPKKKILSTYLDQRLILFSKDYQVLENIVR